MFSAWKICGKYCKNGQFCEKSLFLSLAWRILELRNRFRARSESTLGRTARCVDCYVADFAVGYRRSVEQERQVFIIRR